MDFSKEALSQLIEDATYLQDEIEALKYVINSVPYQDKPGGAASIVEMIGIIDFAVKEFYRPTIEDILKPASSQKAYSFNVESRFTLDLADYGSIEKLLDKIIKHRAALLNLLAKIQPIEWEKKGTVDGQTLSIFQLLLHMLHFERNQLKNVAERVMALERDKSR